MLAGREGGWEKEVGRDEQYKCMYTQNELLYTKLHMIHSE